MFCLLGSLISNFLVAVLGSIALISAIDSADSFRMFTNDGNIYTVIVSVIFVVTNVILLINKKENLPRFIHVLRLSSAVTEAVIFLVVVIILLPSSGLFLLQGFSMLVLHVIVPILSVLSFLLFENYPKKAQLTGTILGSLPVVLYGVIAITLVILKVWTGFQIPYPFLMVYSNPVWLTILYIVGIFGGTFGLSFLLSFLNRKIQN
ncbi:MAG: hypothetical protein H6687_02320 [Bacillales bacterium]|nr:hypothetical protein [Bacillales bacterium]